MPCYDLKIVVIHFIVFTSYQVINVIQSQIPFSNNNLFSKSVKLNVFISVATPSQRSKKNYCHGYWCNNTYASQLMPVIFFPKASLHNVAL